MSDLLSRIAAGLVDIDADHRLPWHDDPAGFARECVTWPAGTALADYQATILATVAERKRLAVRSLHGVGKTTTAALLVLWFAVTRDAAGVDWKAVTTAGAWRQLERYLWPEIHLWARRLRWDRINRGPFSERTELLTLSLTLQHGSAFAVASGDPALIEGAHAESLLYLFDESKAIAADVFDAAEGAFAGPGEVLALASSTPGAPAGRFHQIHARAPGLEDWATRHVTLAEGIAAGRVSQAWADQRARQWGKNSALYMNRVLGEFASGDETGVIPLSWVEAANDRWREWTESGASAGPASHVGVDVARSGADRTAIALRAGDIVTEVQTFAHGDTMATTGRVVRILESNPGAVAVVDVIGIGAGVVDRLRELKTGRVVAFNAATSTSRRDRSKEIGFANTRAAAWWNLREMLDPAYGAALALPPDDGLTGDLVAPRYSLTSAGKILIESKDDMRKRIGRSTDRGDAVVQACWSVGTGQGALFAEFWRRQIAEDAAAQSDTPSARAVASERARRQRKRESFARLPRPACPHLWRATPDGGSYCVRCAEVKEPEQ